MMKNLKLSLLALALLLGMPAAIHAADPMLKAYVKEQRKAGRTLEEIAQELVQSGWSLEEADRALLADGIAFIKANMAAQTVADIKAALAGNGWANNNIERAFELAQKEAVAAVDITQELAKYIQKQIDAGMTLAEITNELRTGKTKDGDMVEFQDEAGNNYAVRVDYEPEDVDDAVALVIQGGLVPAFNPAVTKSKPVIVAPSQAQAPFTIADINAVGKPAQGSHYSNAQIRKLVNLFNQAVAAGDKELAQAVLKKTKQGANLNARSMEAQLKSM